MSAPSKSGINFSHLMSGYDLMESAGKQWMEAARRFLPDTAEEDEKDSLPGMNVIRSWQQWRLDQFNTRKLSHSNIQAFSMSCLEQQKRCSELALAWWKCSLKAMRAVGGGLQKGEDPVEIMKDCIALSEEYVRSCADILAAPSEDLSEPGTAISAAPAGGVEKARRAKTRAS